MFEAFTSAIAASVERAPWGWGVLVILIGSYFKLKPLMQRLANEREASLLEERAEEMAEMRKQIKALQAERAVDRHRLNNVTQCLDALLLLLETAPERAQEHVARIRQMRADQMKAEALEKGAVHAATIGAEA